MTKHNVRCSSIALVKDERLVYTLGYGSESTSLFRIASVSKPITSAVVMMMIEKRLLTLDTKIFGNNGILRTDYGTQPYSWRLKQITVRHLLEHTAGGDEWGNCCGDPMFDRYHLNDNFS